MLEVLGSADVAPGLVKNRHVEARVQAQRYLGNSCTLVRGDVVDKADMPCPHISKWRWVARHNDV